MDALIVLITIIVCIYVVFHKPGECYYCGTRRNPNEEIIVDGRARCKDCLIKHWSIK